MIPTLIRVSYQVPSQAIDSTVPSQLRLRLSCKLIMLKKIESDFKNFLFLLAVPKKSCLISDLNDKENIDPNIPTINKIEKKGNVSSFFSFSIKISLFY